MDPWPISPEVAVAAAALLVVLSALAGSLVWRRRAQRAPAGPLPAAEPAALPEAPEGSPGARLGRALAKSREAFRQRLGEVFGRNRELGATLAALEEALLGADVGLKTATRILDTVRERCANERAPTDAQIRGALLSAITAVLGEVAEPPRTPKPWVILVSGVNGVGKTTSIGKLAARFAAEGSKVLLVAADTFRAAAIDQLGVWAERVGVDVVRHQSGADPASVAFDGM